MFRFVSLLLLVLAAGSAYGQPTVAGTIKGLVVEKDTRQPVAGATIVVMNTRDTVSSDTLGLFSISNVAVGDYTLEISFPGFETQVVTDVNVLSGKTTFREVGLQQGVTALSSVEVKSFKYENDRLKPISSYSFSREEINLNPGAQGDIFRAIGMLPGVSSSGGIYSAISVRGQGVRDNVYMVDDIPLTEVGHLEGNSFFNDPNGGRFSIFAPRVIEHAQFQGGGFGPEYGRRSASYLGLTIKEGNNENSIIDGQVDLLGVTINYDGPVKAIKNTGIFASARYQNFYGLVNVVGLKDIGLPQYGDVIVKTTTRLNDKNKLNFIAMVCPEKYVRDIDNVKADKKLNLLYLPDFKRTKSVFALNLRTLTSARSYWKNVLYFTNYTSDVNVGKAYPLADTLGNLLDGSIPFDPAIQTQKYSETKLGYRSLFNISFANDSKLATGIEMDRTNLNNDRNLISNDTNFVFRRSDLPDPGLMYQPVYPQFVNATFSNAAFNVSGFVNYSMIFFKKLSVNAGVRYDYNGFSDQHAVSPRLSGSYYLNEKGSFNFGYGLYFQDPVYSDIADQPAGNKLKMEEVSQYILSYRHYFRKDIKFTIEAWHKSFTNLVVTPVNGTVFKNNNGVGRGSGIDLNLTKRLLTKLHGQIGFSYIDITRDDNDGIGAYNFAFSQPYQCNVMVSYKMMPRWIFSAKYRYATGKPKDNYIIHRNVLGTAADNRYSKELIGRNELRLPDFSSLDIRINYNFRFRSAKMTAFFDVVNVLNKQIANSESFNPITGQNYYDGLAIFPTGGLKFEF